MTARAIDFDIAELFPEADNDSELVVTIPRSARACYELFADVERLPEWLPIIKSAAVRQRDEHERAIEVAYMATHDRSTVGYRLRYIYSERDLSMSWLTVAGSSIQISGSVQFTPMGEKACLMRYHVRRRLQRHRWHGPDWSWPSAGQRGHRRVPRLHAAQDPGVAREQRARAGALAPGGPG